MNKLLFAITITLCVPFVAFAGSQIYSAPGEYTFTVPNYTGTLTVEVWGGGGGGFNGANLPQDGEQSSFNGASFAEGGKAGTGWYDPSLGGAGGTASGGDVNITGTKGKLFAGGNAAFGGVGGTCNRDLFCTASMAPGGGAGGLTGAGGGGYSKKSYPSGALTEGAEIPVIVGGGGRYYYYGIGADSEYPPGNGAPGAVKITWQNAAPPVAVASETLSCQITFDENPITAGESTIIHWISSAAQTLYLNSIGYVSDSGSTIVAPSVTTDYSGTVTSASGATAECPASLAVNPLRCPDTCPAGFILNGNRCECPTGQAQDNITGQCVSDDTTCPTGQYWNGSQCVPIPACPVGQHWDASVNRCVSNSCPAGQYWNGSQCVPIPACTGGRFWDGSACVCPAGQTWNGSQCIVNCPAGQHRGASNQCLCPDNIAPIGGSCAASIQSFTVRPALVRKGDTVKVSWSVVHALSCQVAGTNHDAWNALSRTDQVSGPINAQTVYTLSCLDLANLPVAPQQKIVNIVPEFRER